MGLPVATHLNHLAKVDAEGGILHRCLWQVGYGPEWGGSSQVTQPTCSVSRLFQGREGKAMDIHYTSLYFMKVSLKQDSDHLYPVLSAAVRILKSLDMIIMSEKSMCGVMAQHIFHDYGI